MAMTDKIKPGSNGPGLASKIGRSGRIRTPDHWFWSSVVAVLPCNYQSIAVRFRS